MTILWVGVCAQAPSSSTLQLLGTRSWIRIDLEGLAEHAGGYRLFWSLNGQRPDEPNAVLDKDQSRYYIQDIKPETTYHVWIEPYNSTETLGTVTGKVFTEKNWRLVPEELEELTTNPGSKAVPEGMQLFWHDEFNDLLLNRNKWFTNYYSSIDHLRGEFEKDMREGNLPEAAYTLNGKTIDIFVNDFLPEKVYDKKSGKKISSIQTYNWRTDENLLDNSRGGYFEARVKRSSTGKPSGLNTAFWFDSPGPDLRYYLEEGTTLNGVKGIRPKGQVFEIDIFEYLNAQFVLHGHVDKNGQFQHNLATHIAKGYKHVDNWVTHGILWTPNSIKHYINGDLIREYTDKHQIYSPNHFMNVLLGSYGGGGSVHMEVDYIRGYQWPLNDGNELPNPGFEESGSLLPWEGTGELRNGAGRNESKAVLLKPGQAVEQYVYLNNNTAYKLEYWIKGKGSVKTGIDNITLVTGEPGQIVSRENRGKGKYTGKSIDFRTGEEFGDHMKTVRISISNEGDKDVLLDDITVKKRASED
ncbi:glycoside hydrolase family 16 protein [Sinomicrobium weinanense]|uniref:glycoside hydrolase family 16 protein n=1 Tax=Sinomicrobium weinanense TaxID=2842200 RepID=UPI001FFCF6DE|nr:glycoside hydrolase family 16 protein [Sinomicrobium weinanense]